MQLLLIVGIVALLLGFLIGQLLRTTKVRQKNQELEKEEQQIQLHIKDLEKEYIEKNALLENERTKKILTLAQRESDLKSEVSGLEYKIEEKNVLKRK